MPHPEALASPPPSPAARLAPATVTAVVGARVVRVALGGEELDATLALAFDYTPRVDDELLVATDDAGKAWAIGVIRGLRPLAAGPRIDFDPETRRTILRAPEGDLELRADAGSVRIAARDRVDLRGALIDAVAGRLQLRAGEIEAGAERLVERVREAYREVEGLAQLHAGRLRTVVDDTIHTLGQRVLTRARGDHKIQGEKIHIG